MRLLIFIFFFITSCSNDMNIESFSKNTPAFKLEEYFNGKTEAWGMFHDSDGNSNRVIKDDDNDDRFNNLHT